MVLSLYGEGDIDFLNPTWAVSPMLTSDDGSGNNHRTVHGLFVEPTLPHRKPILMYRVFVFTIDNWKP